MSCASPVARSMSVPADSQQLHCRSLLCSAYTPKSLHAPAETLFMHLAAGGAGVPAALPAELAAGIGAAHHGLLGAGLRPAAPSGTGACSWAAFNLKWVAQLISDGSPLAATAPTVLCSCNPCTCGATEAHGATLPAAVIHVGIFEEQGVLAQVQQNIMLPCRWWSGSKRSGNLAPSQRWMCKSRRTSGR